MGPEALSCDDFTFVLLPPFSTTLLIFSMAEVTRTTSRDSAVSGDLNKKGEYGYPSGHLGHLTVAQEKAFLDFKKLVKDKGYFKDIEKGSPAYPDDVTLL